MHDIANILCGLRLANVARFTQLDDGSWEGPCCFNTILVLLSYRLVAVCYQGTHAYVTLTERGVGFSLRPWTDTQILHACQRLYNQTQGTIHLS